MFPDGIEGLARGVAAYFVLQGITAQVAVGWTARNRQDNQGPGGANRVVFIPGEFDPGGGPPKPLKAGVIDRNGEQNHVDVNGVRYRAVAWLHEIITCSVWAVDARAPSDELAQIRATSQLREQAVSAIYNAVDPETLAATPQNEEGAIYPTGTGFANIEEWGPMFWTLPPGESAFGRELTFTFTLYGVVLDAPVALVYPQAAVSRNPAA
jgi:hypothetical protein